MSQHRDEEVPLTDGQRDLVAGSLRLVGYAFKKWPHLVEILGRTEAESVAGYALVRAAMAYDAGRGKWSTCAVCYIHGYLRHAASIATRKRPLLIDPVEQSWRLETEASGDAAEVTPAAADLLRATIARLPGRQRQVVEMYFFDGLRPYEIAAKPGICDEAIRYHRAVALSNLRKMIGESRLAWLEAELT